MLQNSNLNLSVMSRGQKMALLKLLKEKEEREIITTAKDDLIQFALQVYPGYKVGAHHKHIAKIFKDVADGKKKRVIINIAPRFGKSILTSYLFPAWFLGQKPHAQIIMATHTAALSEDFGRMVRNIIDSADYQKIFPHTSLAPDSKSAGAWNTAVGGKYLAVGVGGALAGRGGDLIVIDDPHSEQDARSGTKTVFEQAWAWYQQGPRQRLMPNGAIIVLMTRWSQLDLTAKLLEYERQNPQSDHWELVEFPAILNSGSNKEKSLWPEQWPIEELQKTRSSMDPQYWNAQYMQDPTSDESSIIKREWWRLWEQQDPPDLLFVIQTWDTAYEKSNTADFSACTTWGVFEELVETGADAGRTVPSIILMDAFKARMEFPDLKAEAFQQWEMWKPDAFIIEKKASGAPLIYELRATGIPVSEYTPSRGATNTSNGKLARVNAISDIFKSGKVWAPHTRWAKDVIEETAAFPHGTHDDYVDTVTLALMRFRQGGFIRLDSDWRDEPKKFKSSRRSGYY